MFNAVESADAAAAKEEDAENSGDVENKTNVEFNPETIQSQPDE